MRAPTVDGGEPVVDGGEPVVDGGGPVVDGGGPVVDGGGPDVDGGGPVVDGIQSLPKGLIGLGRCEVTDTGYFSSKVFADAARTATLGGGLGFAIDV